MNRDQAAAQIRLKDAGHVNFFERPHPQEYEVGIVDQGGTYWVYWSSERASLRAERTLPAESDALAKFVDYLRLENQRRELFGDYSRP